MNYELFFTFPRRVAIAEIQSFFSNRQNYLVGGAVQYRNVNTGVNFRFVISSERLSRCVSWVGFTMSYLRPHIFALEAEPEVREFVERFEAQVRDPQAQGIGVSLYSRSRFLSSWNMGNETAYESLLHADLRAQKFYAIPQGALERAWRWNLTAPDIEGLVEDEIAVPRILLIAVNGLLRTAMVWPDGIPTLIPEVDVVLGVRDELAPLIADGKKRPDRCLIKQSQLDDLLPPLEDMGFSLRVRSVGCGEPQARMQKFLRSLASSSDSIVRVALDNVVSHEMVCRILEGL
ncbi:hypothetical protein K788_00003500 [Paraburkholderia caribensis MBA4]|uniref:Uncharacterized protein n=1 Tax=Paraburkholderia caribensis MBA4 TaxID=1323664 RepID=A0A0P0RIG5_9BURK|nr:hypothetical protein [Paraburkholderia caribensis]ALL68276.1 hypothetical protein K788_00003500 [Paraburkholderia caribensis MBA4]